MEISKINEKSQAFNGKLYLKGKWPKRMKNAFISSPQIQSLTKNHDVFAHVIYDYDFHAFTKENSKVYKILVNTYNDKSHFNWIRNLFEKQPGVSLTHDYHTERRMIPRFDETHFNYLKMGLGIK